MVQRYSHFHFHNSLNKNVVYSWIAVSFQLHMFKFSFYLRFVSEIRFHLFCFAFVVRLIAVVFQASILIIKRNCCCRIAFGAVFVSTFQAICMQETNKSNFYSIFFLHSFYSTTSVLKWHIVFFSYMLCSWLNNLHRVRVGQHQIVSFFVRKVESKCK